MSNNFKAIVIDNQNDKFTREVKELEKLERISLNMMM